MIYRPNGARTTRHYVMVTLTHVELAFGWSAFRLVRRACLREGVHPDRIAFRRTTTTPLGVTTLFEVV